MFNTEFKLSIRIEDPSNFPLDYLSKSIAGKMCIVALSVSGEIYYLGHATTSESSIVAITNSSKSTIARLSDICIPYYISAEMNKNADVTTQIPAVYTIERLAKEIYGDK